jgi:hypothetical protein
VQGLQLNADEEALVDLVKQSVDVKGTGDQGMIEVYRTLLLSPLKMNFIQRRAESAPEVRGAQQGFKNRGGCQRDQRNLQLSAS